MEGYCMSTEGIHSLYKEKNDRVVVVLVKTGKYSHLYDHDTGDFCFEGFRYLRREYDSKK